LADEWLTGGTAATLMEASMLDVGTAACEANPPVEKDWDGLAWAPDAFCF
jgi:hypothetical protein